MHKFILPIRQFTVYGLIIFTAIGTSCSREGDSTVTPGYQELPKPDRPFEEGDAVMTPVKIAPYPVAYRRLEGCNSDIETPLPLLVDYEIDGDPQDWTALPKSTNPLRRDVELVYQVAEVEGGMVFFFHGPLASWKVKLTGFYEDDKQVRARKKYEIKMSQGILTLNSQVLGDPTMAHMQQSGAGLELFVSDFILDGVKFHPLWSLHVEAYYQEWNPVLFPPRVFQSEFADHRPIEKQHCRASNFPYTLNWFMHEALSTPLKMDIEDSLIRASYAMGWQAIDLSVLVGRVGSLEEDLSQLRQMLLVDPALTQGGVNQDYANSKIYWNVMEQYFRSVLLQSGIVSASDASFLEIMGASLTTSFIVEVFGLKVFLNSLEWMPSPPKSLRGLGVLLGTLSTVSLQIQTLGECQVLEDLTSDCIFRRLLSLNPPDQVETLWINGDDRLGFTYQDLMDPDGDGLPNILEIKYKTTEDRVDSDDDGWSDYAEVLLGSDASNQINHPAGLTMDGLFGDWLNLTPSRIFVDPKQDQLNCRTIDIALYSAIAIDRKILVGAKLGDDFKQTSKALHWLVEFDLLNQEKQSLHLRSGDRFYKMNKDHTIYQAFEIAEGEFEAWMPFDGDGSLDELSVKISIFQEGAFCDDTPWFKPAEGA